MYSKKVPGWLKKIPKGEYSINDVVKMSGMTYQAVRQRFKALGIKSRKMKSGFGNFRLIIYDWKGHEFYEPKKGG